MTLALVEIARRLGLHKSGAGWRGACPACGYNDTFSLRQKGGNPVWFCASCQDQNALTAAVLGRDARPVQVQSAASDAAAFAAKTARALALWNGSEPVPGTPAHRYLVARGLPELANSPALRFRADTPHPEGRRLPALVALALDVNARPVAVHRTFLTREGAKAAIEPPKASLGPVSGAAIRLHPIADEIVIGEGIETAASAGKLLGLSAWSAIAAGNMVHKLALPDQVRRVVIAADADAPGERAARAAALRWNREGRQVRIARPNGPGDDFNDILIACRPAPEAAHG